MGPGIGRNRTMPTAIATRRQKASVALSIFKARGIKNAKDLGNRTGLSYWVSLGAMKGEFSPATRDKIATVLGIPAQELGSPTLGEKPGHAAKNAKTAKVDHYQSASNDNQSTLTDSQKDLVLESLFKSRKASGFTRSEAEQVISHFEEANSRFQAIQAEQAAIQEVFKGKRLVNIESGKVVFSKSPENPGTPVAGPSTDNAIHPLIDKYLDEGKKVSGWKAYYISEKRNGVRYWVKKLGLSSVSDLTLAKFDRAIRSLYADKKSQGTIDKYAQSLASFYEWLSKRGHLAINPIAGKAAGSYLATLRK
jgi:hypothetical protein